MPGLYPVEVSRYNHPVDVYMRINMSLSCLQEYFGLMTGQKQKYRLGISMEVHVCMDIQLHYTVSMGAYKEVQCNAHSYLYYTLMHIVHLCVCVRATCNVPFSDIRSLRAAWLRGYSLQQEWQ